MRQLLSRNPEVLPLLTALYWPIIYSLSVPEESSPNTFKKYSISWFQMHFQGFLSLNNFLEMPNYRDYRNTKTIYLYEFLISWLFSSYCLDTSPPLTGTPLHTIFTLPTMISSNPLHTLDSLPCSTHFQVTAQTLEFLCNLSRYPLNASSTTTYIPAHQPFQLYVFIQIPQD